MARIIHDPPPEHAALIVLGAAGEAFDRLMWSLGVAVAVLILRMVIAAVHPHKTGEERSTMLLSLWRRRPGEERDYGITFARSRERT